jgi:hypothetical protein
MASSCAKGKWSFTVTMSVTFESVHASRLLTLQHCDAALILCRLVLRTVTLISLWLLVVSVGINKPVAAEMLDVETPLAALRLVAHKGRALHMSAADAWDGK